LGSSNIVDFTTQNTTYTMGSSILWVHTFVYHISTILTIFIHVDEFYPFFIHCSSNLPTLYNVEKIV
jgi:hypothetical protein